VTPIHRNSLAAWADLQERGGLELRGRDDGIDEELKNRLAPSARSMEEALLTVTTDELVRAFFDVLQPFVAMFRAILDFFEKAGAAEGREQWNIVVDDVDFRLDRFRRFLKKWDSVPCEVEAPAVDFDGAWAVLNASRDMPEMRGVYAGVNTEQPYWSGLSDVDDWLRAYREGHYQELPSSLAPSRLDEGYSDAAALALAVLHTIRKDYPSRKELITEQSKRGLATDRAGGLSLRTIAQNETDFWLGTLVARLARSRALPRSAKRELGKRLQDVFAQYPRKKFGARIKMADLQAYLSLPIWKKRHELYAVWVATEIVNALPDHRCEIHHEDGRIVFAFRQTLVATVKSCWPSVQLISERRVRLTAPVGEGRSRNVQPDYGLWRHEAGSETCGLIIEVKHYKRSASSRFRNVLIDYARALPKAQVFLVNHGPVGDVMSDVPRDLLGRCHTIDHLTTAHLSARGKLREAVRKYVGGPVIQLAGAHGGGQADTVLAIDVSASMESHLRKPEFPALIREIADERCRNGALIDFEVRRFVPLDKLLDAINSAHGIGTDLDKPVRALLGTFKRALVITDDEGANTLKSSKQAVIWKHSGLIAIEILAEHADKPPFAMAQARGRRQRSPRKVASNLPQP
jgi:hypothetical protein